MPLPLAPVIGLALRYGAVAAIGAYVAHRAVRQAEHKNAAHEAAFDQVDQGLKIRRVSHRRETQYQAEHGDWRAIWLGRHGVEIDSRILARLRFRKITRD